MVAPKRLVAVGLVAACAVIINFGYVATSLYDAPGVVTVVFIPCVLVACLGWFTRSMKATIALTFASILVAAALTYITLTTPVLFGVIEDAYYRNLFSYTVFLKVMQLIFFTMFFSLLTALAAGLAYE